MVDDPRLNTTTPEQWAWYAFNLEEDGRELYNQGCELVEYMMSFIIGGEAMSKITKEREKVMEALMAGESPDASQVAGKMHELLDSLYDRERDERNPKD